MIIDFHAERKKRARARRKRQNEQRKRTWQGERVFGWEAVNAYYAKQKVKHAPPVGFREVITTGRRPYRNEAKKAVRTDRRMRAGFNKRQSRQRRMNACWDRIMKGAA